MPRLLKRIPYAIGLLFWGRPRCLLMRNQATAHRVLELIYVRHRGFRIGQEQNGLDGSTWESPMKPPMQVVQEEAAHMQQQGS